MTPLHEAWSTRLGELLAVGDRVGPRGQGTRELLNQSFVIDSRDCLLAVPARKLNYRFAVAEFVWMMLGHSDVDSIAHYNNVMRNFSDDGMWLTGAYGPHICAQKGRVLEKMKRDPETRQAVIQIPRPPLFDTKDEPCTLSMQFLQREGKLHGIVTMRSSDIWLGIPYDVFTFATILNCFAGAMNYSRGTLAVNAGSQHLYERDVVRAIEVLNTTQIWHTCEMPELPGFPPYWMEDVLLQKPSAIPYEAIEEGGPWLMVARMLQTKTSEEALFYLHAWRRIYATEGIYAK